MESRLTGNAPLLRWGLLRILARVFAGAVHIVYGFVAYLADQIFVTTAELEYLTRLGLMFGIPRKAASFATGSLIFVGTDGVLVPVGSRAVTEDGIEYETTANGTIAGGVADIAATAVEPGSAANMAAPVAMVLVTPIAGISGVTVGTLFTGGEAQENDEDYRARLLFRLREPPAGGTAADYIAWALAVAGVSNAWCFPAAPGPGQVTVVFTGTAGIPAVESYIEERMPVTTDLIVTTPSLQTINFTILITPDSSALRSAITANLSQFFETVPVPGEGIKIAQIQNAISTSGVSNFQIMQITKNAVPKSPYTDIAMSGFEYGVLGTITFGAL